MTITNDGSTRSRGHPAHASSGFRRLTPGHVQADHFADHFDGLPEGVEVHGQLLAAFKAAAPRLGLPVRFVHAIDWLFRFTQPQDWEQGGRPIVWPSASLQQEALCLSKSRVKSVNRGLIEAGLIIMKDSPNGKRYGVRNRQVHGPVQIATRGRLNSPPEAGSNRHPRPVNSPPPGW